LSFRSGRQQGHGPVGRFALRRAVGHVFDPAQLQPLVVPPEGIIFVPDYLRRDLEKRQADDVEKQAALLGRFAQ
jgi:hypothetical protein